MPLEANIKKYYLWKFFHTLSFWLPIFVLFFLNKGLDYTQIMIMSIAAAAMQIIFEVPSGMFADFFGRKTSMMIASFLKFVSLITYIIGQNFITFVIGYAIFGIALAFQSGSGSAFIYDILRDLKRENEYKEIEGKGVSFGLLGMGIGSFLGGFLASVDFTYALIATLVSFGLATIVAGTLHEPKHHRKSEDKAYFKHIKEASLFALRHQKVKWLIVFAGIMFVIMIISHKFIQPYMQLAGIDIAFFGVIYLAWLLIGYAGSRYAHKIENAFGEFGSLLIIVLTLGVPLMIVGRYVFILGILFIAFTEFTWGFAQPIVHDYINQHTESHHRATVLSLNGFFQSILMIIISPFFGYLGDLYSIKIALLMQGVVTLVFGLPVILMIIKSNKSKKKI